MALPVRLSTHTLVVALASFTLALLTSISPAVGAVNCNAAPTAGVDFTNCNLSNMNFSGANLSGANLTNANLSGANLTNANLAGTKFGCCNKLIGVKSGGILGIPANLPGNWILTNGYLVGSGANLEGADLTGANLRGMYLNDTNFRGANLTRTDFSWADLSRSDFSRAIFISADLTKASLYQANLSNSDFAGAVLGVTTGYSWNGAGLYGTDVTGTKFGTSILDGLASGLLKGLPSTLPIDWKVLNGVLLGPKAHILDNFVGNDLKATDLSSLNLSGAGFELVDLSGSNLSGSNLSSTAFVHSNLSNVDFRSTNLSNSVFDEQTDLSGANLSNSNLSGAWLNSPKMSGVRGTNVTGTPWRLPSGWKIVQNNLCTTPYNLCTPPSAPTVTSVVPGDKVLTITFNAPTTDNGGSVVTNYEFSTDGGKTWTTPSPAHTVSPLVISGINKGVAYTLKLRAVNSVGSGSESNAVSVKSIAPASAPTISGVVAGNGQATLSITAPTQINDSSLSGYDYSVNNGSTWSSFPSATGPFTISGLENATAYQVKVRALNSAGAGEASATVTVYPTRLIPARPVIASIVGGNTSATVNITTPTGVTAQSITGYQYSIDKGATYQNAVVSNGSFSITGLTNGVSTSVQIRATNFNGNSLASVAKTVIPATTPAAPGITTITPSAGALSIAFTAPNTGGSAITSYQYSLDGGSTWVVPKTAIKTSPFKITGLPNATSYQVKIRAGNAKGTGLASDVASASTPVLVPSAPVTTSIAKTSTTFTVDVTAPINNGGGAITNYAYSVDNGKTWTVLSPESNSTRIVITGLTPNKIYPVQIAAINSAGRGAASAKYNAGTLR